MLEIEPKEVIYFFEEISKIPRKSGEEAKIADYLVGFAKTRNLEYEKDEYQNVIIRRKESKGQENKEYLALQAHTDMICEKVEGSTHNFSKDPLELYVEGDFLKAKGTTLGADNGIGVALILAILDNKQISAPKIEAIFTVEEETTMLGAIKLDMNKVKSNRIISLDSGKEGKILISSAYCKEWGLELKVITYSFSIQKNTKQYELSYSNFPGGHSGGNIGEEKRGNPIQLALNAIKDIPEMQLISLEGGSRVNVIPRQMKVEFIARPEEIVMVEEKIKKQKEFFGEAVEITLKETKIEAEQIKMYDKETTQKIIKLVTKYPNGAIQKNEKGDVLQSGNIGRIESTEDNIILEVSERSNEKALEAEYLKTVNQLFEECKVEIKWFQDLKGIEKKENNKLLRDCKEIYQEIYKEEMEEIVSQGVVEGGFFTNNKPNCEYVCIGPNTFDVHSPKERVSLSSLQRTWKYLKNLVEKMS